MNAVTAICGPGLRNLRKRYRRCPSCECITEMIKQDGGWWGFTMSCCRCGDSWGDGGEMHARPFSPGWRRRAIAEHARLWALATHGSFDDPFADPLAGEEVVAPS